MHCNITISEIYIINYIWIYIYIYVCDDIEEMLHGINSFIILDV